LEVTAHLEVDGVRQLELPPPHEPVQHYVEEEQVWLDRKPKYLVVAIQDLLDLNLLGEKIFYVYRVDNHVFFYICLKIWSMFFLFSTSTMFLKKML